jgi:hypothetical protein
VAAQVDQVEAFEIAGVEPESRGDRLADEHALLAHPANLLAQAGHQLLLSVSHAAPPRRGR